MCEVDGCTDRAKYEGWHRNRDGFGILTGMMRKVKVCEEHINVLYAADVAREEALKKEKEEAGG